MVKNLLLIALFFLIKLNLCSQIIIVDSITKHPIANVSVFNGDRILINLTNINGEVFIKNDTFSFQSISFSHISYNDKSVEKTSIKNLDTIFLSPRFHKLGDVVLTSSVSKDYIKIKGYYRSYLYNNNIVFAYSDGIVEYYINTKNNSIKNNILSSRLLQRKYENNIKDKGGIKVGNSINPGLPNLTMINSNINKIKYTNPKNYNSYIFIIVDTLGNKDNNEKVKVSIDNLKFNELRNTYKIFGVKIDIISNYYAAEFTKQMDNILHMKNFVASNKKAISFRSENYKNISYEENVQEFYVLESKFVSKNSFNKIITKSDLNCVPNFNEIEIINTSKTYNFPLMPNFIKNQLFNGAELKLNFK